MGKSIKDILLKLEEERQRKIREDERALEEAIKRQREEYLRRMEVPLYLINPYNISPLSIPVSTGGRRTIGRFISFTGGVLKEFPAGPINGTNTVFLLSFTPDPGSEHVYLNGLLQAFVVNYDMGIQSVTFVNPPQPGDIVTISYRVNEG
jgi:hypothetical protein